MQARYQYGDLRIRKRNKGPNVWQFRYIENGKRKSVLIGTVEKYPKKVDAERAVEVLRSEINAQNPQQQFHSVTTGALIDRFMKEYAPKHCRRNTRMNYQYTFDTHIRPRWGSLFVRDVRTMAVQDWLDNYNEYEVKQKDGRTIKRSVSRQVKSHVRKYMHVLFNQGIRWEMLERNPVTLVRQSGKRLKTPRVLTPEEFKSFLSELGEPFRTMVITIACLGLRVCELLALQWDDLDFGSLTVRIQRSIVAGEVNATKNEASEGTLPLDPDLAEALLQHKARAAYKSDSDYVFAGRTGKPLWKDWILADRLKPAAKRAKIGSVGFGWHTFRHSYRNWLKRFNTPLETQRQLMRHADLKTTIETYGIESDVSPERREANSEVVKMLIGS